MQIVLYETPKTRENINTFLSDSWFSTVHISLYTGGLLNWQMHVIHSWEYMTKWHMSAAYLHPRCTKNVPTTWMTWLKNQVPACYD